MKYAVAPFIENEVALEYCSMKPCFVLIPISHTSKLMLLSDAGHDGFGFIVIEARGLGKLRGALHAEDLGLAGAQERM